MRFLGAAVLALSLVACVHSPPHSDLKARPQRTTGTSNRSPKTVAAPIEATVQGQRRSAITDGDRPSPTKTFSVPMPPETASERSTKNGKKTHTVKNPEPGKQGAIVVNRSRSDREYYHLLFNIDASNLVEIEPLTKAKFERNGGQFQVWIRKELFPVEAPNCREKIIARMPGTLRDDPVAIATRFELYQALSRIMANGQGSVLVALELNPYVKVDATGIALTYCNVFFRHANGEYIPHTGSLDGVGDPPTGQ